MGKVDYDRLCPVRSDYGTVLTQVGLNRMIYLARTVARMWDLN